MNYKDNKLFLSLFIIFISLIGIVFVNIKGSVDIFNSSEQKNNKIVILIDPGHGGIDGGAVSKRGTIEKNINLDISLKLRNKLKQEGFTVLLTRDKDIGLYSKEGSIRQKKIQDLNNRCKIKKESNCDLFMSIHMNIFPEKKYYGSQVWYADNVESRKIANIVQENLKKQVDSTNKRKEKPALNDFKVLRNDKNIPSILIECGFLSNPMEEDRLKSDKYQQKIVDSITNSIKKYFFEN